MKKASLISTIILSVALLNGCTADDEFTINIDRRTYLQKCRM